MNVHSSPLALHTPRILTIRLVILDRDGVINHDSESYIKSPAEWVPIPGSLEAIARLHRAGYKVVVATNQSGIGRDLLTLETVARIHEKMIAAVHERGGEIDDIVFCPHTPEDGCSCRKPAPGMLKEIAQRLKPDLTGVYVVGDAERDVVAARQVMATPVLVRTGKGTRTLEQSRVLEGVAVFDDLAAFVDALLSDERVTH
ncbi:MAG: D-glycero-beta-D-manno-heptose 1,7-bisphosphate 7-phosphatase [Acidiferrobacterales bacterium]|nr:D-glycero-beta-D-manno-heptose 1,7-bisphosphate 7-phosphatase [Acidiferrobacterales bacterium]